MKLRRIIALLVTLGLSAGCQSDIEAPAGSAFLKSIDLGEDFITLNAFGLEDGSTVLTCYGGSTSDLIKLDDQGSLLWRVDIPDPAWDTWAGKPLRNGNTLVIGFDGTTQALRSGAVIYSSEGEVLHSVTINNQVSITNSALIRSLDALELSNGQIAVVMPTITSLSSPTMVRLMRFDPELQLVESRIYHPDSIVADKETRQLTLAEDGEGNLLIQGRINSWSHTDVDPFSFVMKLQKDSYDPEYFEVFGDSYLTMPSGVAAAPDGDAVWASAGPEPVWPAVERFSILLHQQYSIGTVVTVWKTGGPGTEAVTTEISGFPKFGFIKRVRACSDGGFILTGTCNFNSNQEIPSDYRILLIKLDSDLRVQWMRVPETRSASVGADAVEIPGGYLVSGSHFSHSGYNNPLVFKTDYDGNIR